MKKYFLVSILAGLIIMISTMPQQGSAGIVSDIISYLYGTQGAGIQSQLISKTYNSTSKTVTLLNGMDEMIDISIADYTPVCFGGDYDQCKILWKFDTYQQIDLPDRGTAGFDWLFKKINQNIPDIKSSDFYRRVNISYNETVNDYGIVENNYTIPNILKYTNITNKTRNAGSINITCDYGDQDAFNVFNATSNFTGVNQTGILCFDRYTVIRPNPLKIQFFYNNTGIIGTHLEERWRYDYSKFNYYGQTLQANKTYFLLQVVDKEIGIGDRSVDVVPNLFGIELNEFTWLNSSWAYRENITVNGSTTEQTDYQVQLYINSSRVGANFNWTTYGNDTRFSWLNTTSGAEQEIPFWIESWYNASGTGNATIWVKIPNITASSAANTTLYMYYGNPNAASASNGVNTFDFFDDFSTNTLSSYTTGGSGTATYNSTGYINIISSGGGNEFWIYPTTSINKENIVIDVKLNKHAGGAQTAAIRGRFINFTSWGWGGGLLQYGGRVLDLGNEITQPVVSSSTAISNDVWNNVTLKLSTNYKYLKWGLVELTSTSTEVNRAGNLCFYVYASASLDIDDIRIHKAVDIEPTLSIGAEQTQASDTTPPNITITSPTNITYGASVWFNITGSEALSSAWFSLDGTANITMTNSSGNWNYQNTSMSNGAHNVRFFANDTSGNLNASANNNVSFTVGWTFKGIVKDKNLNTVSGAIVYVIYQPTNATVGTAITNSTGGWNYTVNTLGNYTIAAENRNNISQGGGINPHIVVS